MESEAQRSSERGFIEIKDVLNDVIAEGILHEMETVGSDLANELNLLEARSVINAPLENAASVTVSSDSDAMRTNRIEDELSILSLEMVQALLNDVIAIKILNQRHYLVAQSIDNGLDLEKSVTNIVKRNLTNTNLLRSRDELDHLL
jgi:hypothetical protein